jgi:hypothetical protein
MPYGSILFTVTLPINNQIVLQLGITVKDATKIVLIGLHTRNIKKCFFFFSNKLNNRVKNRADGYQAMHKLHVFSDMLRLRSASGLQFLKIFL